ncbi:MAG TPA: M23 family metallopeptidase [Thermoanaerobaculia bacterium]|nr:M23 family metallopeptidase [Thermoanaerobaculia bacterium]
MASTRRRLAATTAGALLLVAALFALRFMSPLLRHPLATARLFRTPAPRHLPVPVDGVRPRGLIDSWGSIRSGGRHHQGIDIFAPRNTPIRSTTSGIVVTVGVNRLGGRIVRILGPGPMWHYYAHLERYGGLRPGDEVQPGDVVGYVGDSGNARGTPPHLHYGIYRFEGGAVNPYPFLR